MRTPLLEVMEPRLLLSGGTLAAHASIALDLDGLIGKEAILANTGNCAIEYTYGTQLGPNGESDIDGGLDLVTFLGGGGSLTTNTWATSIDGGAFNVGTVRLGASVRSGGKTYIPVYGTSSITAGSLGKVIVGQGDLAGVTATVGGIDQIQLDGGMLSNVTANGDIGAILNTDGAVIGSIYTPGDLGKFSASYVDGASIIAEGNIGKFVADEVGGGSLVMAATIDTIATQTFSGLSTLITSGDLHNFVGGTVQTATIVIGGTTDKFVVDALYGTDASAFPDQFATFVTFGGAVKQFQANTISGGNNGTLFLTFGAGVDRFIVGLMEGGYSDAGHYSEANIAVSGTVGSLQAGLVNGGTAMGAGAETKLTFSVTGDVAKLRASVFSGGTATNGGNASMDFNVGHDLIDARIGQITGSGITAQPQHKCDPSVNLTVYNDIVSLVVTSISAGTVDGDGAIGDVNITAYNDIRKLIADTIDAGTAAGVGSTVAVNISAGRDINLISANTFSGGISTAGGAMAGVYVTAGRNINMIAAGQISGTQARRWIADPTVQFIAGGDIGKVVAGLITGGTVTSNELLEAESSVLIRADGTYVDDAGAQSEGDIGAIYAGTIRGGTATGAQSLSHVNISAAHDVKKIEADTISGGRSIDGGESYVDILAENDILSINVGTIRGSENGSGGGGGCGDPFVQIQAYNDIKSIVADQIIAGPDGTVNILAGINVDADGNSTGGSLESLIVGLISGQGGIVNIAAGGDIGLLKASRIISGDGEVNIVACGDMTVDVRSIRSWVTEDATGVSFSAGGTVNDVRGTIADQYTHEDVIDVLDTLEDVPLPA